MDVQHQMNNVMTEQQRMQSLADQRAIRREQATIRLKHQVTELQKELGEEKAKGNRHKSMKILAK